MIFIQITFLFTEEPYYSGKYTGFSITCTYHLSRRYKIGKIGSFFCKYNPKKKDSCTAYLRSNYNTVKIEIIFAIIFHKNPYKVAKVISISTV
jgi:hypothetical protein